MMVGFFFSLFCHFEAPRSLGFLLCFISILKYLKGIMQGIPWQSNG